MRRLILWTAMMVFGALAEGEPAPTPAPVKEVAPSPAKELSAEELDALCDTLEENLKDLQTLRARTAQEKHLSIFSDVVRSEGVHLFAAPNSVRMETTAPYQSVLIVRGRAVVRYEYQNGEWRKLNMGSPDIVLMVTDQISDWMRGKLRTRTDLYDVSAFRGERTVVTLTPRHADFQRIIDGIDLTLSPHLKGVESVKLREPSGDFTLISFHDVVVNQPVAAEVFATSGKAPVPLNTDSAK